MYPISYEADFNPTPNRATTFFRIILAIPWIIVATFWGILFAFTHFFAWVAIIILGRYPQWLYNFNSGVIRFLVRSTPGSTCRPTSGRRSGIGDDPSYPIRVNFPPAAERQSRLKALFRIILALPMLLVSYAFGYLHTVLAASSPG